MLPYRNSRITYIALGLFFLAVVVYAYFESRGLLLGPTISVSSDVQEVHDPLVRIKGQADRIASLSMNGKQIAVTETGAFDEPYLLSPGYNRIVLDASDKYGRHSQSVIELVYSAPTSTQPILEATSTPEHTSTSTVAH